MKGFFDKELFSRDMYFDMTCFFIVMLSMLLVMNIFWSFFLMKAVVEFFMVKKMKAD